MKTKLNDGARASFTEKATLSRYLKLVSEKPELARNPPDGDIVVLTEPDLIRKACREVYKARAAQGLDCDDVRAGVLASDPYMTVVRDAVRFSDGGFGLYNRVIENGSVAVLPVIKGRPVVIRIFRHALRDWCLEFPRGAMEPGESAEETVCREIREEIGAEVERIIDLGPFTPGGSSICILSRLFYAEVSGIRAVAHAEGISEAIACPVAEVERLIADGRIFDGFSIAVFARARLKGLV